MKTAPVFPPSARLPYPSTFPTLRFVFNLASLLLIAGLALGQGITGTILGTVEDQTHATIPSAAVTVTNQDTNQSVTVPTGSQGNYIAPSLPPGRYRVSVKAAGFREAVSANNVVVVNGTRRVDFLMQVGDTTASVEVQAGAPLVESTTSSMGNDLDSHQVSNLPLNGRIFSQLVQTMPGSVATGFGSSTESASGVGATTPITASVNGVVWQGTTYTLDGVSNMELENSFMNVAPPVDDIEEVKVSSNNSSADVGTYGGAQVNAFIKSGTNNWHGGAYEYFKDAAMSANTWANDLNHVSKAPFLNNDYGALIGGPIKKNKAFFFVGYEGIRLDKGFTYTLTLPTALMRQGFFPVSQFGAGIFDPQTGAKFPQVQAPDGSGLAFQIPVSRWDPVAARMLANNAIWPAEQRESASNNFSQNVTEATRVHKFDVKVDYQFRSQDHAFVRESYERSDLNAPTPTRFLNPSAGSGNVNSFPRDHNAAIGYTHLFSATSINELRLGFDRFFTSDFGNDLGSNENTALGIPNGNIAQFPNTSGLAAMSINSNQGVSNIAQTGTLGFTDAVRYTNTYQIVDNFSWVRGKHNLGVGADYRRLQAAVTNADHQQAGQFTFDQSYTASCVGTSAKCAGGAGFADFLLGLPTSLTRDIVNTAPSTRLNLIGAYIKDDYRLTRNLTVNLALRWDLVTYPVDKFNRQSNLNINTGFLDVAHDGNRTPNVVNSHHNFAPRVGLAYSPDDGRTAFRGAFGLTYFPDHFGAAGGTLERNWPWFEEYSIGQVTPNTPWGQLSATTNCVTPAGPVANCFVGLPGFVPQVITPQITPSPAAALYYVPRHFQPDTVAMWNVGVQRELTPTTALDIAYVGTRGANLFRSYNIDVSYPGPGIIGPATDVPKTIGALQANRFFSTLGCIQSSATATIFRNGATIPVCINGPLATIQAVNMRTSNGYSRYDALQARFTKGFSHGLQALLSYTWSKEIDDLTIFVPYDDRFNRGLGTASAPDIPHNFIASFVYELPFGKGRDWMSNAPTVVDTILGGWQLSGITKLQHGTPLVITNSTANNGGLNSGFTNRANFNSSQCGNTAGIVNKPNTLSKTPGIQWFDTQCFSDGSTAVLGNAVAGNAWGPGLVNFDLNLSKTIRIRESMGLKIGLDAFDALNTPHFNNPSTGCCTGQNSAFGVITSAQTPRQLQLGAKFSF
ncbi:MAG TPA: carboxypeptidase regulatory-like domain-containing protein [Terriglobales bacterium]|nr:carboxypeptidase regulatory-like domain-containing protein [Terriglobales bacterium]